MVASAARVRSASSGIGVVGHRRRVRAEQHLRDDAAVAIPQAADDGVPQGAVHQHPVQQHHDRPVAASVGVHEASGRRPLALHPQTPSPMGVMPAHRRCRVAMSGRLLNGRSTCLGKRFTCCSMRPACSRLSASGSPWAGLVAETRQSGDGETELLDNSSHLHRWVETLPTETRPCLLSWPSASAIQPRGAGADSVFRLVSAEGGNILGSIFVHAFAVAVMVSCHHRRSDEDPDPALDPGLLRDDVYGFPHPAACQSALRWRECDSGSRRQNRRSGHRSTRQRPGLAAGSTVMRESRPRARCGTARCQQSHRRLHGSVPVRLLGCGADDLVRVRDLLAAGRGQSSNSQHCHHVRSLMICYALVGVYGRNRRRCGRGHSVAPE